MWGDAGYTGVPKRAENRELAVEWQVALRLGKRRKLEPGSEQALAEQLKASVRARVEHPFLKTKRRQSLCSVTERACPVAERGTLPGTGQGHPTPGLPAGVGESADGPEPTDPVTHGQWPQVPAGPGKGGWKLAQRTQKRSAEGKKNPSPAQATSPEPA